jgi:PAS domain S-box-containing protein/putative nucleotidyltransferase with HDIG domain
MVLTIVILSALFQLAAAILALRLIKLTGQKSSWILIALAMFIQAGRRVYDLIGLLSGDMIASQVQVSELIGLAISVLMFVGVAYIGPFFSALQRAIVTEKQAEEALRRSNRELRAISSCNQTLIRTTEEQPLLDNICNLIGGLDDYPIVWVGMIEHNGTDSIKLIACHGTDRAYLDNKRIYWGGKGNEMEPVGASICSNKTYCVQDVESAPGETLWLDIARDNRCRSFIALPLADRGDVFGVLNIYAGKASAFSTSEVRMLEELAGDLAFGISHLRSRVGRIRAEEALLQAEKNYRNSLDDSPLGILVVSPEGEVRYANRALLDIYGYADLNEFKETPRTQRYTYEAYAEHLLRVERRKRGDYVSPDYEISVIRKTGEVRFLQVSRKELLWDGKKQYQVIYRDITDQKRAERKLERTLDGVVKTVAMTVEMRDPYTAGHQRRVAQLSKAIAKKMGLSEDQVNGTYIAGLLHDIGKITTPAEILSKPGKLNANEFGLIKAHALTGYDILKNIDFPYPLARCAAEHHERKDGSGYPAGLKGDEICLEARILAVADVVEAMASHRPYRPALGIDAALAEILKYRDTLYDSQAVDACLDLFKNEGFIFEPIAI